MSKDDVFQWWSPQVGDIERKLVGQVLESNYINEGPLAEQFETKLAELLGCKHVVVTSSGTAALFLALAALDIGANDEVIVPDITFIATANAVSLTGAKPVLVDIDPETLCMDPNAFSQAINERTRAVIPVHISGRACDMNSIMKIAEANNIYVVEDAAEAFMSKFNGRYLGTIGKAGAISFSPNKTITTGQGGAILVNDDKLHVRLHELKDQGRPVKGTGGDDIHYRVGYNFKFTDVQAAIGLGQLNYLKHRVERLKQTYQCYTEGMNGVNGISLLPFNVAGGESPQWIDAVVENRNDLDQYLSGLEIRCRRFWFPLHTQAPYKQSNDNFPNSTKMVPHAIWLPSALTLSDSNIATICNRIKDFMRREHAG